MATRPQGVKVKRMTAAGLVFTGIGNLYSVFLSWRGATAGDSIALYDGTTAGGAKIFEILLSEANNTGVNVVLPAVGIEFGTGLYLGTTLTGTPTLDAIIGYDGNG